MTFREEKKAVIDETLIAAIAENDTEALRKLYEQASSAVFAYAFSILKNREDAKDVMQDTFLKIRSAAHLYVPQGKPAAWILTIAKNLCNMKFRTAGRLADTQAEDFHFLHDRNADRDHELKVTLEMCFKELDDSGRQIIILHIMGGMKHREIAAFTGLPLATVLSKYHRGLKKLRTRMEGVRDE